MLPRYIVQGASLFPAKRTLLHEWKPELALWLARQTDFTQHNKTASKRKGNFLFLCCACAYACVEALFHMVRYPSTPHHDACASSCVRLVKLPGFIVHGILFQLTDLFDLPWFFYCGYLYLVNPISTWKIREELEKWSINPFSCWPSFRELKQPRHQRKRHSHQLTKFKLHCYFADSFQTAQYGQATNYTGREMVRERRRRIKFAVCRVLTLSTKLWIWSSPASVLWKRIKIYGADLGHLAVHSLAHAIPDRNPLSFGVLFRIPSQTDHPFLVVRSVSNPEIGVRFPPRSKICQVLCLVRSPISLLG